jgi:hypothetical protein
VAELEPETKKSARRAVHRGTNQPKAAPALVWHRVRGPRRSSRRQLSRGLRSQGVFDARSGRWALYGRGSRKPMSQRHMLTTSEGIRPEKNDRRYGEKNRQVKAHGDDRALGRNRRRVAALAPLLYRQMIDLRRNSIVQIADLARKSGGMAPGDHKGRKAGSGEHLPTGSGRAGVPAIPRSRMAGTRNAVERF